MKQSIRFGALAALAGALTAGAAHADSAQTLGGIQVKSDDGKFVGSLGGRIQFDYTGLLPDNGSGFDSGAAENNGGFNFRRVYISLAGSLYGWRYRLDDDVSNTNNPGNGFQDAYISHDIGDYGTVRLGQTRPWRSLDGLASNNDITFTERNITSDTGIYGNRDYAQGIFYRYSRPNTFTRNDNFWGGVSFYSLNKAGSSTDQGITPTQGIGYNARLAYAPINTAREWIHTGVTFSSDHADNGATLSAGSSTWYSYRGVTQSLISLKGTQPAATGNANIGGGNSPDAVTIVGELAGAFGPLYLQGEGGESKFRQPNYSKTSPNQQTVDAFAFTGSVFLTGETKRYDTLTATYAQPKPLHPYGALEIAVGYNFERNRNLPGANTTVCKPAVGAIKAGTTIDRCDLSYATFGINYYVNPGVRFMFDYYRGDLDLGNAGHDRPQAVDARVQIVF